MSIVTLRHSSRRFWGGRHRGPDDLDTAQLGELWGDGELLPSPSLLFFLVVLPLSAVPPVVRADLVALEPVGRPGLEALEPLYDRSLGMLAPVLGGSGVRIKVLEP